VSWLLFALRGMDTRRVHWIQVGWDGMGYALIVKKKLSISYQFTTGLWYQCNACAMPHCPVYPHVIDYIYIHTFTKNFHLLTCILAINVKVVPRRRLPALYPTTPVNEPPCAFNNAPAIGVPISPLTY
jgi:hypothetical protein